MSVVYKVTITRPNYDSLFFMELTPEFNLATSWLGYSQSYVRTISYEPTITWSELYARKHELRPDLLFFLDSIDIESITKYPSTYAPYPFWNPFSLSWTHLITFDTVEELPNTIEAFTGPVEEIKDMINSVGSTVIYEELLIDGIPDPTFVKKYL